MNIHTVFKSLMTAVIVSLVFKDTSIKIKELSQWKFFSDLQKATKNSKNLCSVVHDNHRI